jgi:hypothetical protein
MAWGARLHDDYKAMDSSGGGGGANTNAGAAGGAGGSYAERTNISVTPG